MRSFIIACVILITIISLIIANTFYVTDKIDSLLIMCEGLREGSSAQKAEELFAFWQSCRNIISLSVHNSKIEETDNAVLSLNAYLDSPKDFYATLSILTDTLNHIKESQRFSAENIF